MMLIMAVRMATNQIVHVKSHIPIHIVLLVEFLYMMDCGTFAHDFTAEIANRLVPGNDIKSDLLPQFRFVDLLVVLHCNTL